MMISTKGRYALRVMVDLAEHADGGYLAMREVAKRQEISLKYLERILPLLVDGGLVEGLRGKGGGYRLTRSPEEYPLGEILRKAEGSLSPVACLDPCASSCHRSADCPTLPLWQDLERLIDEYLDGKTLADLITPRP
ncbi:MAG: RrF2 family transcriptional regulator [Oscillospiraceae bacterium]|nr:RrF2 family transcriptional regulator [Oscillospiraceae bacterium]